MNGQSGSSARAADSPKNLLKVRPPVWRNSLTYNRYEMEARVGIARLRGVYGDRMRRISEQSKRIPGESGTSRESPVGVQFGVQKLAQNVASDGVATADCCVLQLMAWQR